MIHPIQSIALIDHFNATLARFKQVEFEVPFDKEEISMLL